MRARIIEWVGTNGQPVRCCRALLVLLLVAIAPNLAEAQSALEPPAGSSARTAGAGRTGAPAASLPAGTGSEWRSSHQTIIDPPRVIDLSDEMLTPELESALQDLHLAQVKREVQKIRETEGELWWTNWIGRAIFVIVQFILIMGLVVAWSEFRAARRQRRAAAAEQQEVRISMEGIALKTSLHGILILGIALAFYFLYLRFVFPVTYVGQAAGAG